MKHNLCVKISYKKYLLANTSFPPPVVLQYTSGGRKSLEPECGIATLGYTLQWHFSKGRRKPAHLEAQKPSGYVR